MEDDKYLNPNIFQSDYTREMIDAYTKLSGINTNYNPFVSKRGEMPLNKKKKARANNKKARKSRRNNRK